MGGVDRALISWTGRFKQASVCGERGGELVTAQRPVCEAEVNDSTPQTCTCCKSSLCVCSHGFSVHALIG